MKIIFYFKNLIGTQVLPKISIGLYDLDGVSKVAVDNVNNSLEIIVNEDFSEKAISKVDLIARKIDENLTFEYSYK